MRFIYPEDFVAMFYILYNKKYFSYEEISEQSKKSTNDYTFLMSSVYFDKMPKEEFLVDKNGVCVLGGNLSYHLLAFDTSFLKLYARSENDKD